MGNEKTLLISNKYAESLLDLSKSGKISADDILKNLDDVKTILKNSDDLFEVLTVPTVSVEDKLEIVDKVFTSEVSIYILNFLKLLVEKNRINLILDIIEVFKKQLDDINNIARVDVVSSIELSDDEKNRITNKLTEKLNKSVMINWIIDESIIAGLVIKMGDDVIDMSISHKLEELKKAITK